MNDQGTSIADVLSGKTPIQFNVTIDVKSLAYLGVTLVLVVGISLVLWRVLKNS